MDQKAVEQLKNQVESLTRQTEALTKRVKTLSKNVIICPKCDEDILRAGPERCFPPILTCPSCKFQPSPEWVSENTRYGRRRGVARGVDRGDGKESAPFGQGAGTIRGGHQAGGKASCRDWQKSRSSEF